jgi:3-oxoacyl-[acyl-carrier-protein] synthase III
MKILSIGVALPSLKLSNDDILDDVRRINEQVPRHLVEQYTRTLRLLLKKSGAHTRFWRNRDAGESSNKLIHNAMTSALHDSGLSASDIDMVIYFGVGRGFLEPANAYFCAKMMDMNCVCFDVSDACMSYVRALEIAQAYLLSGKYKNILIVNSECTVYEYGYPDLFKIRSTEELQYTLPAYTIGEAATATIVNGDEGEWQFHYDSVPSLASLCTIPLEGFRDFVGEEEEVGQLGVNRFVSFSSELFQVAVERIVALSTKVIDDVSVPDIWFPHTAASTPCIEIANILGVELSSVYIDSFQRYGNLASASIPTAMWAAMRDNQLERGMKVVLAPGSAGMSFAIVEFVF